ncbi:hypothetical protein HCU64_01230 [Methylobacterium sp. C25]|uniref:hypothetical protein n=1 Tax=Methylobacterium sp. C25 TaxID=2721622 RepID=UPI001F194F7B|nr:hypothetical protein [Methylobacterium sp. C25]MCE4222361.1 hypothetical protein [Methylobacterium sp. C25]
MDREDNSSGWKVPFELRWRIAILAALAIVLSQSNKANTHKAETPVTVTDASPVVGKQGWGMAGMLPGVSPITLGRTLYRSSNMQASPAG